MKKTIAIDDKYTLVNNNGAVYLETKGTNGIVKHNAIGPIMDMMEQQSKIIAELSIANCKLNLNSGNAKIKINQLVNDLGIKNNELSDLRGKLFVSQISKPVNNTTESIKRLITHIEVEIETGSNDDYDRGFNEAYGSILNKLNKILEK